MQVTTRHANERVSNFVSSALLFALTNECNLFVMRLLIFLSLRHEARNGNSEAPNAHQGSDSISANIVTSITARGYDTAGKKRLRLAERASSNPSSHSLRRAR